jgi:hypothetical protein
MILRRRLLSVPAILATVLATPLAGVVTAHAANVLVDCSGLDAALAAAVNNDVITLHDSILCTGAHTLKTGVNITLQGQAATDGFDGGGSNQILHGADNGNTIIRNLIFQNAGASANGAAIGLTGNFSPTITQDFFYGNTNTNEGGAVAIVGGSTGTVTVTHSVFGGSGKGNTSTTTAGALYLDTAGSKIVTDNVFDSNTANFQGGAVILSNLSANVATIDFERNQVTNNALTVGGVGGGVQMINKGGITVIGNVFTGNRIGASVSTRPTNLGGGLYAQTSAGSYSLTQSHNLFRANTIGTVNNNGQTPYDFGGGGEFAISPTVSSLDDSFFNNTVAAAGTNTTPVGGGFALQGNSGIKTTLTARNLVAANNSVGRDGEGGGIYAGFSPGCISPPCTAEIDLFDSTVDGNAVGPAGTGAGIAGNQTDTADIVNSIVYGNTGNAKQVNGFGTIAVNHSDSCQAAATAYTGTGNVCVDPKLANVAGNDVHETAASPTIDAGDTAQVPSGLTSDYEGDARVQGAGVDIGADEFTPLVVTPTLPNAGVLSASAPAPAAIVVLLILAATVIWGAALRGHGVRSQN